VVFGLLLTGDFTLWLSEARKASISTFEILNSRKPRCMKGTVLYVTFAEREESNPGMNIFLS
jgi:hypothetical protein